MKRIQSKNDNSATFSVTFETKCYERDWEFLLKTPHLRRMVRNCGYNFTFKQLIINNVDNREIVKEYAQRYVDEGVIDAYYFVDDYIEEVLQAFELTKESLGKGYCYSVAELVGLYLSRTDYHLHFSSDSFMPAYTKRTPWIEEACQALADNPECVVVDPVGNHSVYGIRRESTGKVGKFYLNYGFSDRCYLVRTADFKAPIYNYKHKDTEHYPKYGGELFEKRVNAYMRTFNRYRLTLPNVSYIHYNFHKSKFGHWITMLWLRLLPRDMVQYFRMIYYSNPRC